MWNEELWTNVLLLATIIAGVSTGIVQVIKNSFNIPVNWLPIMSIAFGIIIGILSYPFTDAPLVIRLWAGALSGFAGTGIFEAVKSREGKTKE
ncbi:holin [Paenibacillus polysaccharolyticus]|jgi:hypothetical protein|uniref:holin n=1 Tax=Paenibacillus polysaccharolyticus TaxID=582692 RepID=UPI00203C4E14|nr:holin [Paenibacillus polysaccharolyticus]MCM3131918.1 holin [Paenibacillus polysaccharolyticus]